MENGVREILGIYLNKALPENLKRPIKVLAKKDEKYEYIHIPWDVWVEGVCNDLKDHNTEEKVDLLFIATDMKPDTPYWVGLGDLYHGDQREERGKWVPGTNIKLFFAIGSVVGVLSDDTQVEIHHFIE